jgi:beta-ribofuranosylaminobenzene 5'-phosphate synthase
MIHVRTGSRLHFGLIDPAGIIGRYYGGAGLMIDAPSFHLTFEPADAWAIEGPAAERARSILDRLRVSCPEQIGRPQQIRILEAIPEHRGLGSGTQLALSVARGLAEAYRWPERTPEALASLVARGARSALGIHGFAQGGFLFDAGKAEQQEIAPLAARVNFPDDWRIVLVIPNGVQGLHGDAERTAFAALKPSLAATERLSRLALTGILPALTQKDFAPFSEALYDFNRLAGESFRGVQDGVYANADVAGLVGELRNCGVAGVGQSSWGPAVFAVMSSAGAAAHLADNLKTDLALSTEEVTISAAKNSGAVVNTL